MPRKKTPISLDDILSALPTLTTRQTQQIITAMQRISLTDTQQKNLTKVISYNLDSHAEKLKLGKSCPKCGSLIIKKNGKRANGTQRLQCKDCGYRYTYFSGTLLDNTHFSWDLWVEFIYMMITNASLAGTKAVFKNDFGYDVTEKTILNNRLKVLEICKEIQQPTLTGIIEVDETSFHESQKGSKNLIDPLDTSKTRKARLTSRPSKYGALGPEFGTVVCAVDHTGHTVSKYVGVGRVSAEVFNSEVASHFKDATHLCSDANNIYSKYCKDKNIIHYVRPSDYLKKLKDGRSRGQTDNDLYNLQQIDYIVMPDESDLSYTSFKDLKDKFNLSISRVNQVHSRLKQRLQSEKHGITLKNIDGYVCWETLLINYGVDTGHNPASRKDAECILAMLLKTQSNALIKNIYGRECDFSNMNLTFQKRLMDKTDAYRKSKITYKEYISSEDMGDDFNLRDFLDNSPIYALKFLCDYCKIRGRSKIKKGSSYRFKRALETHPDIEDAIDALITTYGTKKES